MKTLTPEQQQSFHAAAQPLMKWLNENCHPHCEAVVGPRSAELVEGQLRIVDEQFIKD